MPIKIRRTQKFESMLKKLVKEDEEWIVLVEKALIIFLNKPKDTRLKMHDLKGKLKGMTAISVTKDVRIVFKWVNKKIIKLIRIGDHKKVYGKK